MRGGRWPRRARCNGLELGFSALVSTESLLKGAQPVAQFFNFLELQAVVEQIPGGAHAQDRVVALDGDPGDDVQTLGNQGLHLLQGDGVSLFAQPVKGLAEPGFLQPAAEGGLADAGPAGSLDYGGGCEDGGEGRLLAAGQTWDIDGPLVFGELRRL